jgi:hypothetical protein
VHFNLTADPHKFRILGTGGLADPGNGPGSYIWTAIADPETRLVAGWLTSDRGSGVVFSELSAGKLRIKPNQTETLEAFAVGYSTMRPWGSKGGPTWLPKFIV